MLQVTGIGPALHATTAAAVMALGLAACQTTDVTVPTKTRTAKTAELVAAGGERLTGEEIVDAVVGRTFEWESINRAGVSGTATFEEGGTIDGTFRRGGETGSYTSQWYLSEDGSLLCEQESSYHGCSAIVREDDRLIQVTDDGRTSPLIPVG